VLGEAVSQTKYCYLLKVKIFGSSQNFVLATPLLTRLLRLVAPTFCQTLQSLFFNLNVGMTPYKSQLRGIEKGLFQQKDL